jgi:hypothetical protein
MKHVCAYDSEQTMAGLIHHICITPVYLEYNRKTGAFFTGKGLPLVIEIEEVTKFYKDDALVQKKTHDTRKNASEYLVLPWRRAIPKILSFVVENGPNLFSHAWHRDLVFLSRTQEFIGGKQNRIFHKTFLKWPETGCYDANWHKISRVCSLHFLLNRCPKFMKEYTQWYSGLPYAKFKVHMDLEHLARFVYGDAEYRESHTAIADCIDLVNVLIKAFRLDKFKLDGASYYISEKSCEPSIVHNLSKIGAA